MDKFIKILRIVLILFIAAWILMWYARRAEILSMRDRNFVESTVISLCKVPGIVEDYFLGKDPYKRSLKQSKELYELGKLPADSYMDDSYHLLYYSYLGGKKGKVFLRNIKNGEVAFSWKIPLDRIMEDTEGLDKKLSTKYMNGLDLIGFKNKFPGIKIWSPIMTKDSSLIFHSGYLYKLDKNSNLLWKSKQMVHHSIELDSQENIWACSVNFENEMAKLNNFRDDAILCMNQNGKVKHFFSLYKIFSDNNLFRRVITSSRDKAGRCPFGNEPFHLNDIQPVKKDGKYWKQGDLFLSMRNKSLLALYRPATDSIIWCQNGPWEFQHDVNIINDSVIACFNNNASFSKKENSNGGIIYNSNIAYYNFANGQTSFFADDRFLTKTEGRQIKTYKNDLIIEATNKAKYYVLDSTAKVQCKFYIPAYSDSSKARYPKWSRVYRKKCNRFIKQ